MSTADRSSPLSSVLRAALADHLATGGSLNQLERDTGLQRASLSRFLQGKTSLHLSIADVLAKYLGVEARRLPRRKGKE